MDRFLSIVILTAVGVPSCFIVVWVFPGLEPHEVSRSTYKFYLILYALAIFATIAVVAVALFFAVRFLIRAVRIFIWRNKADRASHSPHPVVLMCADEKISRETGEHSVSRTILIAIPYTTVNPS